MNPHQHEGLRRDRTSGRSTCHRPERTPVTRTCTRTPEPAPRTRRPATPVSSESRRWRKAIGLVLLASTAGIAIAVDRGAFDAAPSNAALGGSAEFSPPTTPIDTFRPSSEAARTRWSSLRGPSGPRRGGPRSLLRARCSRRVRAPRCAVASHDTSARAQQLLAQALLEPDFARIKRDPHCKLIEAAVRR